MEYPNSYIKKCNALEEFKNKWYPTLEELFQLFREMPKNANKSDLQILSNIRIAMSNACCNRFLSTQSIHDLFIIAYAREKHGLDWFDSQGKFK